MYASAEKRVWTWRSPKNGIRSESYRLHGSRVSVRGQGGSARAEGGTRTTRASSSPSRARVTTANPSDTGRLAVKVRRGAAWRRTSFDRIERLADVVDHWDASRLAFRGGGLLVTLLVLAALAAPARADLEAEAGPVVDAARADRFATNLGR